MDYAQFLKKLAPPPGFIAPTRLSYEDLVARAITRSDLHDDVRGINASIELIQTTRGGGWPEQPVSEEFNFVDLVWHELEFREGTSFTYVVTASGSGTRLRVAAHAAAGRRASEISADLGLAKATVSYHLKQLNLRAPGEYVGRRAVIEILGRSGVRASELCDLRLRDVRLHDPDGARFRIPDAKTQAGIREVQMSPDLVEAFVEHLDRLRRAGRPVDPDAHAVPNLHGGRMSRQRVGQIVGDAAREATRRLTARGLPPLPNVTPHTLRRTYISIALLANNFDVK